MAPASCFDVPAPKYLSYFTAAISIFLAIVTIPGNTLVCVAIIKDPFRELRTPFSYFLLSLAATDLLVGTLMDSISAVFHLGEGLQLALVDIRVLHVAYFILCTASILTLAALTVDRYYAVMAPLKYKTRLTPCKVLFASIVIWGVALISSMLYFKLGFILYSLIFANTAIFFTIAVLFFVYAKIYQQLRRRVKNWSHLVATSNERKDKRNQLNSVMAERKVTKAFVLVLLAFLISFTPACVMIYILNFCDNCDCVLVHWLRDLQFIIVLLNSGINPYIYALRLPQFKKVFYKMYRSLKGGDNLVSTSQDVEMIVASPNVGINYTRNISVTPSG